MSINRKIKNQYVMCWAAIIIGFAISATRTIPTIGSLLVLGGVIAWLVIRFKVWYAEEENNV